MIKEDDSGRLHRGSIILSHPNNTLLFYALTDTSGRTISNIADQVRYLQKSLDDGWKVYWNGGLAMSNRLTIQVRVSAEDKELFLFKSRNHGFDSIGTWLKWLAKNAPVVETDIHKETASELFGVDQSEVTEEQRRVGKNVNFMKLYGSKTPELFKREE